MQTTPHSKLSTGLIIIIIISSTLLLSQIPKQFLSCKTHPQMNQLFAKTTKNHTKCTRHPKTIHCILMSAKILTHTTLVVVWHTKQGILQNHGFQETKPSKRRKERLYNQPQPDQSLNRMRQDRNINTQVYTELEKVETNTPKSTWYEKSRKEAANSTHFHTTERAEINMDLIA